MCNLYTMTASVDEMRRLTHDREQACALAVPFPNSDMRRIDTDE